MARIEGILFDTEIGVPIHDGDVYLRTVDGRENIHIDVTFPDGSTRSVPISAPTDIDGRFVIEYAPPGEYMLVGKSFVHHATFLMLTGDNSLEEPGLEVRLETTPATIGLTTI